MNPWMETKKEASKELPMILLNLNKQKQTRESKEN